MAFLVILSRSASAAISLYVDSGVDTQGLPGFKTYEIFVTDTLGRIPAAFDFYGDGSTGPLGGNGIFGPMNQVNPVGLSTIFNDNNGLFASVGALPVQDSQFKFNTSSIVHIANYSRESVNRLQTVFAQGSGFPANFTLAQIVVPNQRSSRITYAGAVAFQTGELERFEGTLLEAIPEPSTFVLTSMIGGVVTFCAWRRRGVSAGLEPIEEQRRK